MKPPPMLLKSHPLAKSVKKVMLIRYRMLICALATLMAVIALLPLTLLEPSVVNKSPQEEEQPETTRAENPSIQTNLTLRTPIFVASLPKSGTTSAQQFFGCGGIKAAHTYVKSRKKPNERTGRKHGGSLRLGICMDINKKEGKPLFDGCGRYAAFSDAGYVDFMHERCFYPSIEALPEFYKSYPNATIILFYRNATNWYRSLASYGGGKIFKKWKSCNLTAHGAGMSYADNETDEEHFIRFYLWHRNNLRSFAAKHPSITYLEFSLEGEETGLALQASTGVPATCWQDCAPRRDCSHVAKNITS